MTAALQSYYIVRFSDCDPFGHLNNARYLDYMLNAREDHMREEYKLSFSDFAKQGVGWVTTRNEIQYLRPAYYNEKVCIQSKLLEVTETDLLVEISMFDESRQQLKALLWGTFTHVNIKNSRRETHTHEMLQFLNSITATHVNVSAGFKARLAGLLAELKENSNNLGIS